MYQILSRANGQYPTQSWIASPNGVYSDSELERALADFLRCKAEGQRIMLLWVPDYDQGRGHQGMDHLSPARCPEEYRAAATGLFNYSEQSHPTPGPDRCLSCDEQLAPGSAGNAAECDFHDQTCDRCDRDLDHPHGRAA